MEHATRPPCVLRLAKRKSFILALFPLGWARSESESSVQARLALAQAQRQNGSVVRLQITPAPGWAEALARGAYRAREKLRGGRGDQLTLFSPLTRDEMMSAEATQNQALFWLEAQVASAGREDCWEIAEALAAERGPNELRASAAGVLAGRRFLRGLAPFRRSLSSLVSAAEAAYLLEPPRGRALRGVAVDRAALPRASATPRTPAAGGAPLGPPRRETGQDASAGAIA